MKLKRALVAALAVGLGAGVAGCTDGYGYGGLDVGYGAPYGYADDYYGGYGYGDYGYGYGGYGYGYPAGYGWFGNYYYPGSGIYVYDRYRRPYRWNDQQRRYWQGRPGYGQGGRGPNWNGFDHRDGRPGYGNGRPDGRPGFGGNPAGRPEWRGRPDGGQRPAWRGGARDGATPTQPQAGNRGNFGQRGGGNRGWSHGGGRGRAR